MFWAGFALGVCCGIPITIFGGWFVYIVVIWEPTPGDGERPD